MIGQPPRPNCAALAASLAATVSLFYPATSSPGAEDSVPAVSEKYLTHFTGLLEAGFGSPPNLEAAERHYQSSHRLRPDDPRLEYAFGLVLLENLKYTDAVDHFRQAAESDTPYLPAERAAIRELIRQQDYDVAIGQLVSLAKLIGPGGDAVLPVGGRIETARWIGRAMAFLAGPLDSDAVRDAAAAADITIRQTLGNDFGRQYDHGRQDVGAIVRRLQQEQQAAEDSAKQKRQQERTEAALRLQEYESRQEQLQESKKTQDLRTADTVGELDTKLAQLTEEFETLNKLVNSLLESVQTTQIEIELLENYVDPVRRVGKGRSTLSLARMNRLRKRTLELNSYLSEYTSAVAQRQRTMQAGRKLLAARAAAAKQARQSRGVVTREIEQVEQWDARLRRAMEQAAQAPASSVRMRALANRVRSFTAYDEFDPERERRRMQHAYAGLAH